MNNRVRSNTAVNRRETVLLVPELSSLIEQPCTTATPEQFRLLYLTQEFYKHVQKFVEAEVLPQWLAAFCLLSQIEFESYRKEFWKT